MLRATYKDTSPDLLILPILRRLSPPYAPAGVLGVVLESRSRKFRGSVWRQ